MKKINLIVAVILFTCSVSCKEDVLLEDPKALVVEDFYNTAGEVEAALAAIYAPIRGQLSYHFIGATESQTEWGAGLNGATNFDGYKTMKGLDAVSANNLEPVWNALYVSIRNANLVIKNTPNSLVLTDIVKNQYVGEAKFMRALCYFYLVRSWGGVPLYTDQTLDQTSGVAKSTSKEIYDSIVADLVFAETNLPDKAPLLGKPSKVIAKAVLADVYFYMGLNSEAGKKAEEVILSGKFSLVKTTVADDFNKIFGIGVNSPEEVFYLKYNNVSPSGLILYTQQIQTPWFGTPGYGIFTWHKQSKLFSNWNNADLRKSFTWYETDNKVANRYTPGQTAFPTSGVQLIAPKKWSGPTLTISAFDLPIYRYPEILLLYAEATVRTSNTVTPDAMEKLNMVHRRAYGYDPLVPSAVDFKISDYTPVTFIDLLVRERGYEFQMEGKRWYDLVRSGRVKTVMKDAIDRDVLDKHLLWPIPDAEFQLNEAMKPSDQNPGY